MRTNDNSRIASYNAVQLFNFDHRHLLEGEDFAITSDVTSEFGLDLQDIQALRKKLEKS